MKHSIYYETSALVKKYIANEEGSQSVMRLFKDTEKNAEVIYTSSIITKAEVYAALASGLRGRKLTRRSYMKAKEYFDKDWKTFKIYEVTNDISNYAAYLTTKTELRLKGADSIQLATAIVADTDLLVNCDKDITQYIDKSTDFSLRSWDPIKQNISEISDFLKKVRGNEE